MYGPLPITDRSQIVRVEAFLQNAYQDVQHAIVSLLAINKRLLDDKSIGTSTQGLQQEVGRQIDAIRRIARSVCPLSGVESPMALLSGDYTLHSSAKVSGAVAQCNVFHVGQQPPLNKRVRVEVSQASRPAQLRVGPQAFPRGLAGDLVVEIHGLRGCETLSFAEGTPPEQIAAMVNIFSESTGVSAQLAAGHLELSSTESGSHAFVEFSVISEPAHGMFRDSLDHCRALGTDLVAEINGVPADGSGNTCCVDTPALALELQVRDGFAGLTEFSISGGGLTWDVAGDSGTLGIPALSPQMLGYHGGHLYEIGCGQRISLLEFPQRAKQILLSVYDQLAQHRERLARWKGRTAEMAPATLSATEPGTAPAGRSLPPADQSFARLLQFGPRSSHQGTNVIHIYSGGSVLDATGGVSQARAG